MEAVHVYWHIYWLSYVLGTSRRRSGDAARSCGLRHRSDLEALDQGIGQELGAHPLDLRACGRHIAVLDLQLDEATDARTCHCESEGREDACTASP